MRIALLLLSLFLACSLLIGCASDAKIIELESRLTALEKQFETLPSLSTEEVDSESSEDYPEEPDGASKEETEESETEPNTEEIEPVINSATN